MEITASTGSCHINFFYAINYNIIRFWYKIILLPKTNLIMKFLTIAAICALASSVSSLKLNHQLDSLFEHNGGDDANRSGQSGNGQGQGKGPANRPDGRGSPAGHGPKDGQGKGPGGRGDHQQPFDWKSFTSPCTTQGDKTCWKNWFSSQLTCKP